MCTSKNKIKRRKKQKKVRYLDNLYCTRSSFFFFSSSAVLFRNVLWLFRWSVLQKGMRRSVLVFRFRGPRLWNRNVNNIIMCTSLRKGTRLPIPEARYRHVLKIVSKCAIFRFSLILIEKSLNFCVTFTAASIAHFVLAQKLAVWGQKFAIVDIQFHIVNRITNILKDHYFLEMAFFHIPFLKSHNSLSFWARELEEVLFGSKFFTDYHTSHNNSISTTCFGPFSQRSTHILCMHVCTM